MPDIDLTSLTDDDLDALRRDVLTEQERRQRLASTPDLVADLGRRYLAAEGTEPGQPWRQPQGAHDAYPEGWRVTHGGTTWESLTPANVWRPGQSGWREVSADPNGAPPEWVAPTGAHDAYRTGDLVTFEDAVYRSTIDGNTWSPTDYPAGWEPVE